jgi:tetratricopeptide (TPR) repeat protein
MLRRNDDAVSAARRASELNPLSVIVNAELATALESAGRYEEAIQQFRKAHQIDSDPSRLAHRLALTYYRMGDLSRAFQTLDSVVNTPPSEWGLGFAYLRAIQGRTEEARRFLAELERRQRREYVSPQNFASVYLGLGERELALSLLEKTADERAFEPIGFSGVISDVLIDNPRFRQLLQRIGLAGQPGYAPRRAARSPR